MSQLKRFFATARVNPLWSPPLLPVADAVFIDILAGRLHSAYLEKLYEADSSKVLPRALPEYTLYEAALLGGSDQNLTYARYEVMEALLQDTGRGWLDVSSSVAVGSPWPRDAHGFVKGRRVDPMVWRPDFSAVAGLRIDVEGHVTLLLARPSAHAPALFSAEDVRQVLALKDQEPLAMILEPPKQRGAGMAEYPHHPFQSAAVSPVEVAGRLEQSLIQAALGLQQLASGTEAGSLSGSLESPRWGCSLPSH